MIYLTKGKNVNHAAQCQGPPNTSYGDTYGNHFNMPAVEDLLFNII